MCRASVRTTSSPRPRRPSRTARSPACSLPAPRSPSAPSSPDALKIRVILDFGGGWPACPVPQSQDHADLGSHPCTMVPVPVEMSRERFEELVSEALDEVPGDLLDLMDNVVVLVEDDPPPGEQELLGLYEGHALTSRG